MKVTFAYDKQKDVWCLLNKGKNSSNSAQPTKQYQELVAFVGENPTEITTTDFIDKYITDNNIDTSASITEYQSEWNTIAEEYQKRAEAVFGVTLPHDITAYLSINSRSPYNLQQNYFFIAVPATSARKTAMHELWHFYTWQKFGQEWEDKLGKQKYNDTKESLTVLLNVECKDLLPEGVEDAGYPQHQELRKRIETLWAKDPNINHLWAQLGQ